MNVEELMAQVSFERAAAFYGVQLPEIHRVGNETRMRCFLNCGRKEKTGDRALAIQADHPAKIWRCRQYGCGKGGNLVSLCDLMKPGPHAGRMGYLPRDTGGDHAGGTMRGKIVYPMHSVCRLSGSARTP